MACKRYLTAWSRHHRSGGFGIHSPYAFRFVRHVWRQPLPYYAYERIHQLHATIKSGTTSKQQREMDLIGEREARLLFRVTNFFNPQRILQAGAATGVESLAMMEVNGGSRLYLYDGMLEQKALAVRVLQDKMDRVECYDDVAVATEEFLSGNVDEMSRLALINEPIEESILHQMLDARVVLIMRHLSHDKRMASLFESCCSHMTKGQTYTNEKIALLIPDPKLQREDFLLWL